MSDLLNQTQFPPKVAGLQGRLPRLAPEDRFALKWAHEYLAVPVDPSTLTFPIDVTEGITNFGLMGNGDWGNCAECGKAHLDMTTATAAGTQVLSPDSPQAVDDYKEFAGATTPPGPGTSLPDYLQKLFKAGKIKAWAPVDHTNRPQCLALMSAGFGLYIGVNLFDTNMAEFNANQPFAPVPGGSAPNPEEGHCVNLSGATALDGGMDKVITWGFAHDALATWTKACLHENPDGEAYLIVTTDEQLAKFTPALLADIEALDGTGGAPAPADPPAPSVDPPAPGPVAPPMPTPPAPLPEFYQQWEADLARWKADVESFVHEHLGNS